MMGTSISAFFLPQIQIQHFELWQSPCNYEERPREFLTHTKLNIIGLNQSLQPPTFRLSFVLKGNSNLISFNFPTWSSDYLFSAVKFIPSGDNCSP